MFRRVGDLAKKAVDLVENLPRLWEDSKLTERRTLLSLNLDADYVDHVEERSIVVMKPKPAFQPLFEVANTREGSNVILITETPPDLESPEAESPCFWWRRGRVELHQKHGLTVLVAASWSSL